MFLSNLLLKVSSVYIDNPNALFSSAKGTLIFARFPKDIRPLIVDCLSEHSTKVKIDKEVKQYEGALLKLKVTVVPDDAEGALINAVFNRLQEWCMQNDATVLQATETSSGATLFTITPGHSHKGVILARMLAHVAQDPKFSTADLKTCTACFGDDFGPGRNDTNLFDESKVDHRVLILSHDRPMDDGYPSSPVGGYVVEGVDGMDSVYSVSEASRSVGAFLSKHPEIRVVVSDYDGTIKPIGKGKKPDSETLEQLAKVLAKGGYVAIATGASSEFLDGIKDWLKSLFEQNLLTRFSVHMYGGNVMLQQPQLETYLQR